MKYIVVISLLILTSSCTLVHSLTVPNSVLDAIARSDSVAQTTLTDPPLDQDLAGYLKANAKAWEALAKFYGLRSNE